MIVEQGERATNGADVYDEPWLVTVIEVTAPPETAAVAVAPVPCPPEMITVGAVA
jgi:hypothetical protein